MAQAIRSATSEEGSMPCIGASGTTSTSSVPVQRPASAATWYARRVCPSHGLPGHRRTGSPGRSRRAAIDQCSEHRPDKLHRRPWLYPSSGGFLNWPRRSGHWSGLSEATRARREQLGSDRSVKANRLSNSPDRARCKSSETTSHAGIVQQFAILGCLVDAVDDRSAAGPHLRNDHGQFPGDRWPTAARRTWNGIVAACDGSRQASP